jgi:hypothetical protein
VHARTLLVTIPEPAEVLAEMVRLARPGGWVARPQRHRPAHRPVVHRLGPQASRVIGPAFAGWRGSTAGTSCALRTIARMVGGG